MTQEKSDQIGDFSDFSDRTNALAAKLGLKISDLSGKKGPLGMSQDMVMGYRTGRHNITRKAWRKLREAEAVAGIAHHPRSSQHQAQQLDGPASRGSLANSASTMRQTGDIQDPRMTFAPGFAPKPAEPTAAGCLAHLQAYLTKVQEMPGGVAHTWVQLQLHFPLEQAERMADLAKKI